MIWLGVSRPIWVRGRKNFSERWMIKQKLQEHAVFPQKFLSQIFSGRYGTGTQAGARLVVLHLSGNGFRVAPGLPASSWSLSTTSE